MAWRGKKKPMPGGKFCLAGRRKHKMANCGGRNGKGREEWRCAVEKRGNLRLALVDFMAHELGEGGGILMGTKEDAVWN